MTKTFTSNGKEWVIVQVPKDTIYIEMSASNELAAGHQNTDEDKDDFITTYIDLPTGQYTLHCIAEEATIDQAIEVAERSEYEEYIYKMHDAKQKGTCFSKDSVMSLIRSLFPNWADFKHVILQAR